MIAGQRDPARPARRSDVPDSLRLLQILLLPSDSSLGWWTPGVSSHGCPECPTRPALRRSPRCCQSSPCWCKGDQLARFDIVILDELGYVLFDKAGADLLFGAPS